MRVDGVSEKGSPPEREVRKKRKTSLVVSPFLESLTEAKLSLEVEDEGEERDLGDILRDLDEAGERLKEEPSLENLKRYKSLVKAFLKEAISRAYRVKEVLSRRSGKLFILIEKVDRALEDLVDGVLRRQVDALWIASKIEEIRGLLIDIYR